MCHCKCIMYNIHCIYDILAYLNPILSYFFQLTIVDNNMKQNGGIIRLIFSVF